MAPDVSSRAARRVPARRAVGDGRRRIVARCELCAHLALGRSHARSGKTSLHDGGALRLRGSFGHFFKADRKERLDGIPRRAPGRRRGESVLPAPCRPLPKRRALYGRNRAFADRNGAFGARLAGGNGAASRDGASRPHPKGEGMNDLERAKEGLSGHTLCLARGEEVLVRDERGIAPMMALLAEGKSLIGFSAADRVVGKAAAMLFVKAKIRELFAETISRSAAEFLEENGLPFSYRTMTEYIVNRDGTGRCPMESAVLSCNDAEEGYLLLQQKLASAF